ncbi:amino acid adenylation domain-containing protein [Luteimonas salinilitoris]|uniref:Amino acid adenylation domain-containing protein n=1 Tax=Luteimonas salinilitoris TaxID=3237697 RepID=A0ABV4HL97_9GAMM
MNEASTTILPLTTAQRGLWVGHKIGGAEAVMNIAEAIEIRGSVDPALFRRALHRLTCEMETARVNIVEESGLPRQVLRPEYGGDFPFLDFSGEPDPRASARRWMMDEIHRPVDLARDPLWVGALIRLAEDASLWYHRAHHVVYDGYSGGMAARRLAELYTALVEDREPAPSGFGNLHALVEAEAAYRGSPRYERDRAYWLERLADLPDAVSLARRRVRNPGGLRRSTGTLCPASTARLRAVAAQCGVSLPQVLIALIAAYYHRATGAGDLVFGMPVTGRVSRELRATPGMVANAVTIRLSMTPDMTMPELFAQVARVVRSALRHQQYRFEDLRRDLGLLSPDRHIAWLGVNIEPFEYVSFGGHPAIGENLYNGSAEDLTIFVYDRANDQGLAFDFDANPTLYAADELDEHRRRLFLLIEQVSTDPGVALGAIDVLGARERTRLLTQWNDTAEATAEASLPLHLFARQAARMPDAPAVAFGEQTLSYRELDALSTRQARQLVARGIRAGDLVAVALPRDERLPAALLAIWKAGAAYLPLDPDAPRERIRQLIDLAAPRAILTIAAYAAGFGPRALVLPAAEGVDADADADAAPPIARPGADDLAYVIFTSGSTGVPKGVEVGHGSFGNFLLAMQRQLSPGAGDCFLAQTTLAFDIAGLELFLPLTVGAQVVVAASDVVHNPPALARLIRDRRISVMQATPSLWRVLLASAETQLSGVHALVGGEALPTDLARKLVRLAARVTNLYGPTETTVWSTAMPLDRGALDAAGDAPPPIGRPLRNTHTYVLDAALNPMPTGCTGELYIAGAGVARGYRHRPDLTARCFVDDPFSDEGGHMYRTGDLARWREDGVLEFLGRVDQQLKIRGHRVEPGEIEAHLIRHAEVAEAAVVPQRNEQGDTALVAYLVGAGGETPRIDSVRSHLAARLPDCMLPVHYMVLPALPLTPSGKLDRRALPLPDRRRTAAYAPPTTDIECKLVALWQEVLGVERVGIHDNFFELGGDSLGAAELMAGFPRHFAMELPLGSLFEAATVAGLAAQLERAGSGGDPLGLLLPLRPTHGRGGPRPLFCLPPATGFGWSFAGLLRHLDEALPVYALQSAGLRGGGELSDSLEAVAADCLVQIRQVQPEGPYRLLGWSLGGLVGHAVAARLLAQGERIELLAMMDAYPFLAATGEYPDEAAQAQAALRFLGFHRRAGEGPPRDMRALTELLCREYEVFSMPLVRRMMQDGIDLVGNVARVTQRNLELARRYRPARIDADLLFFNAAVKERVDLDGVLHYHSAAWRPYVAGELEVHDVDSHHQAMLEPRAAAQIARVLQRRLARQAPSPDELPQAAVSC